MKPSQFLALTGISLLAMSNSCQKESDAVAPAVTTGRVVRYEPTVDNNLQNARTRWVVDLSPMELPGVGGKLYRQAKVFNLPDTLRYKAGTTFQFHYQLVPIPNQTPWKSYPERFGVPAAPYDVELMAEIAVSDVQIVQTK